MKSSVLPDNILRRMNPEDRAPMGKAGRTNPEINADNAVKMEKTLHNLVTQYLNLRGIFFIHSQFGKRTRSTPGVPDFVFAINGQACGIECKTAEGQLSKDQEETIAKMRCNGWSVEVCASVQQAISFINRHNDQAMPQEERRR